MRSSPSTLILFQCRRFTITRSETSISDQLRECFDRKQYRKLLQLFHESTKQGQTTELPSQIIVKILQAAAKLQDLSHAIGIHQAIPSRLIDEPYIISSLVHMYMECGDTKTAEDLFKRCKCKSIHVYGAVMAGFVKNNQPMKALNLFETIQNPNEIILTILFHAGAKVRSSESLALVKKVSSKMPQSYLGDTKLVASLIAALMHHGDVLSAEFFYNHSKRKSESIFVTMMKGYVTNDQPMKALKLFEQIQHPSEIILTTLFNACAQIRSAEALELVKKVSANMSPSYLQDPILVTSLIDALMKCGDILSAESYFNRTKTKSLKMYGALMKGYVINHQPKKAIDIFHQVKVKEVDVVLFVLLFNACAQLADGKALALVKKYLLNIPPPWMTNARLTSSLMDALIKCGDCDAAEKIFPKTERSMINYGSLMDGFNDTKQPEKTLLLYEALKRNGMEADQVVFLLVIKALSQVKIGRLAIDIIGDIPKQMMKDSMIQNSLIGMWAKIGVIDQAKRIFESVDQPNEYSFSAMIHGYGVHGMGGEALEVFHHTPRYLINEVTYLCILHACSHSGFVEPAQQIFDTIQEKSVKIYTAMIDCLSRAALFDRAELLMEKFESYHSPHHAMYLAFLSGARNHKNIHLAEQILARMSKVFPDVQQAITTATILLGNMYGSIGDAKKLSDLRSDLTQSGVKKVVGASWTAPDGQLARFRAHDRSHPRSTEIYAELELMSQELLAHGHRYNESYVTRMLNEDETVESVLCGHSEKLAIAWNFVVDPHAKRIEVSKNLRVCVDCHEASKRLASIRQCEFIINDANRLHHVTPDGRCSCCDYF